MARVAMADSADRRSRLVLGSADLRDDAVTPRLLERYHEAGGRSLDLANVYGDGTASRGVGRWLGRTGTRADFTLWVKGCHPPLCSPTLVEAEVEKARSLLGVDTLDTFLLHRDDPAFPVEAFADALQEQADQGRMASFGVSNWTLERFESLVGVLGTDASRLAAFSNHFSLATMATAPWPGCLAMTTEDIATLGSLGVTALSWASLAGGYLAGRDNASWESDENDARRRRAAELADELGTTATSVALAYVLHQPDHVLAAIGTRSEAHLEELVAATGVTLTAGQIAWLEGGPSGRYETWSSPRR